MNIVTRKKENTIMELRTTCQKCGGYKIHTVPDEFAPPNSYESALKARAASEERTPEQTFEAQWKASRLRELAVEHAALNAHVTATPSPRLTAAEVAKFDPPDPYQIALDNMRSASR